MYDFESNLWKLLTPECQVCFLQRSLGIADEALGEAKDLINGLRADVERLKARDIEARFENINLLAERDTLRGKRDLLSMTLQLVAYRLVVDDGAWAALGGGDELSPIGPKIEMLKNIHKVTGLGLKQSKDLVDLRCQWIGCLLAEALLTCPEDRWPES